MLSVPPVEWLVAIGAVLALAFAVGERSFRERDRPGGDAFVAMMAGITVWCGAYALQLFATTQSTFRWFLRVEYLGTVFVPVAWFVFVLEYTGRDHLVTRRSVLALCVLPVATIVAVWTNPLHHVMWTERSLATAGGLGASSLDTGFWAYFAYSYFLLAGALWFLLEVAVDASTRHRRQAQVLVVAALVPIAVQVVVLVGPAWAPAVNVTPFSFVLSGVLALGALEYFALLESDPVAARVADDRVVAELDDGVLVVDATGEIVDANRTALELAGESLEAIRGRQVDACVPTLSPVADVAAFGAETVTWSVDGEDRHLRVSASAVETSRGKRSGWVMTLSDVTAERRRQRRTEVLNRVLRETLRTEMDVVSTRAAVAADVAGDASAATRPTVDAASVPEPDAVADLEPEPDAVADVELDADASAAAIRERAAEALAVGEVAEEFEALYASAGSSQPVDVVPVVQAEADAISASHPGVAVTVDAPLGEWAYCGGLFEPTVRALLRFGAERASAVPGTPGTLTVDIENVDANEVRVWVRFDDAASPTPAHRRLLSDGVDADVDADATGGDDGPVDVDSPEELSCWLVHWGVERLGGALSVDEDVVALRLPRHADPQG